MSRKYANIVSLILVLVALAFAAWIYPQIPNPVPTHWNGAGRVDGYTPKPWGIFIMPIIMLGVWLIFAVLPTISPKGFRLDAFIDTYNIFQLAILSMLLVVAVAALLAARVNRFPLIALCRSPSVYSLLSSGTTWVKCARIFSSGLKRLGRLQVTRFGCARTV